MGTPTLTKRDLADFKRVCTKIQKTGFPVPPEFFDIMCGTFITVPIELAVLRKGPAGIEVFLVRREKDFFFPGDTWHMPGTIQLPGRTTTEALRLLVEHEVGVLALQPEFLTYFDVAKGSAYGECPRGQEVPRLFVVWTNRGDEIYVDENRDFFLLKEIRPESLLANHQMLIDYLRQSLGI